MFQRERERLNSFPNTNAHSKYLQGLNVSHPEMLTPQEALAE